MNVDKSVPSIKEKLDYYKTCEIVLEDAEEGKREQGVIFFKKIKELIRTDIVTDPTFVEYYKQDQLLQG